MGASTHRVIQWATGNTGQRALREVIRDPILDLVGVLVYDSAKDGVDAGELCGKPATRILATTNRENVLALDADCCVYMPRATGSGKTRAGLSDQELVDDVVALLQAGTSIVTTCTDLFAKGARLAEENRARVLKTCAQGDAAVWASGSDPGFITETLLLALLSVQRRVDLIEIEEFGDLSRRPSRHMVIDQMRFGTPLEDFGPDRRKNHLFGEYQPALAVLADIAGLAIDEWTAEGGVAAAKEDLHIAAGEIQGGWPNDVRPQQPERDARGRQPDRDHNRARRVHTEAITASLTVGDEVRVPDALIPPVATEGLVDEVARVARRHTTGRYHREHRRAGQDHVRANGSRGLGPARRSQDRSRRPHAADFGTPLSTNSLVTP
jgi:hypothetical protein